MGRPPVIDWQSWEPLEIGAWCEARRAALLEAAKRLPLWAAKLDRTLKPLNDKRRKLIQRREGQNSARSAINAKLALGEIDKATAAEELAQLLQAIEGTNADLEKLRQRYIRTTEKALRGRGRQRHSRIISLAPRRPWRMEDEILIAAAAHFSKEWSRRITKRAVRSAWDDLRSILKEADSP